MNRLVSILLLTFIASCSRSLSDKEVVGVYEFRSDPWRQEVRVSPNGKYINALYRNNLLVWSDQGEWIYDEVGEERGITFNDFRFGMPDSYKFDIPEYANVKKMESIADNTNVIYYNDKLPLLMQHVK